LVPADAKGIALRMSRVTKKKEARILTRQRYKQTALDVQESNCIYRAGWMISLSLSLSLSLLARAE
jgi:hypothetical protein